MPKDRGYCYPIMLCRCCLGKVVTRDSLLKRGTNVEEVCVLRNQKKETPDHLFLL